MMPLSEARALAMQIARYSPAACLRSVTRGLNVSMDEGLAIEATQLGAMVPTRAASAGMPVWLATRSAESARALRSSGLRVSGVGGTATAGSVPVAALEEYRGADKFDLILLATKAHEALEISPFLSSLLTASGTLLPIQNGGVSQILSDRLGGNVVLGGVSNLGATMAEPGVFEQRNAGHLLIGELAGGLSERVANVARALSGAIEHRKQRSGHGIERPVQLRLRDDAVSAPVKDSVGRAGPACGPS